MDFFRELGGRRLFSELRQILDEDKPVMALRRIDEYDLLKMIHPKIVYNASLESLLNSVEKVLTWYNLLFLEEPCLRWMVYLLALLRPLDPEAAGALCDRLELTDRHRKILIAEKASGEEFLKWMALAHVYKASDVYKRLRPLHIETLLYIMASSTRDPVKRAISKYITQLRSATTLLTGNDLKEMGFEPGPVYREILSGLLDARLNGEVKTRTDEVAFVRTHFRQEASGEGQEEGRNQRA
jgi:tRNA nucleotidyltransferase (CCA-adding enzyme)